MYKKTKKNLTNISFIDIFFYFIWRKGVCNQLSHQYFLALPFDVHVLFMYT